MTGDSRQRQTDRDEQLVEEMALAQRHGADGRSARSRDGREAVPLGVPEQLGAPVAEAVAERARDLDSHEAGSGFSLGLVERLVGERLLASQDLPRAVLQVLDTLEECVPATTVPQLVSNCKPDRRVVVGGEVTTVQDVSATVQDVSDDGTEQRLVTLSGGDSSVHLLVNAPSDRLLGDTESLTSGDIVVVSRAVYKVHGRDLLVADGRATVTVTSR